MIPARILSLALFVLLLPIVALAENSASTELTDKEVQLLYADLRQIGSIGLVALSLVGDAEKIGLNEKELNNFVKERFRAHFKSMPFEDVSKDTSKFLSLVGSRDRKVGNITLRVWVVGDEFPLAYHVRGDAGNFENPAIWTEEILGHGSKKTAPDAIKEIIDEMMRNLSVIFSRARALEKR
jgi:hypothetical protein